MNDRVGNTLAAQGVSLHSIYGATEVGFMNAFSRRKHSQCSCRLIHAYSRGDAANPGMDWAYWSVTTSLQGVFRPMGDGTYEVVIMVSLTDDYLLLHCFD